MAEEPKVKWVRKLNSTYVYPATEAFLKRNDLFPCDIKGNLLSTGTQQPPSAEVPEVKPDESDDAANAEANARQVALMERAKELGIKNPHTMKEATLLAKIAAAEQALQESGAGQE